MTLSKADSTQLVRAWLAQWAAHDLDGVLALIHEDVVFENWTGAVVTGKRSLRRAWLPWFADHDNFRFIEEDLFVDEHDQKVLLQWRLEWPSSDDSRRGQLEIRRGVDVLHFRDRLIHRKYTYSKTNVGDTDHGFEDS